MSRHGCVPLILLNKSRWWARFDLRASLLTPCSTVLSRVPGAPSLVSPHRALSIRFLPEALGGLLCKRISCGLFWFSKFSDTGLFWVPTVTTGYFKIIIWPNLVPISQFKNICHEKKNFVMKFCFPFLLTRQSHVQSEFPELMMEASVIVICVDSSAAGDHFRVCGWPQTLGTSSLSALQLTEWRK